MDFSLSDEQLELGRLTAGLLRTGAAPAGSGIDRDLWDRLAEADLLGVVVPEEYGGLGLGLIELGEMLRQFGQHIACVPLLPAAIAGAAIARFGTEPLKKAALPEFAAGRTFPTEAFSTTTSDAASSRFTLAAAESGGTCLLRGTLSCVPYAAEATWLVARASTTSGPRPVVIDLRHPGISVELQHRTDHSPAGLVRFDAVPAHEVLETPDAIGWITQFGTVATCAVQLGVAQRALQLTAEYTGQRRQFGRPLAGFQAVGQRAADAYIDTWAQELTLHNALWRIAAGLDAALDVHLAKLWAALGGQRVVAAALHLHGGTGADRSYPLHRFFLAQTELSARFGGPGQQLSRLGDLLRDAPGEVL